MTDEDKREYLKMNLIKPLEAFQDYGDDITTENFANMIDFELNAVTEMPELPIIGEAEEIHVRVDNLIELKKQRDHNRLKYDERIDMYLDIRKTKLEKLEKLEELIDDSVTFILI